MSAVTVLLAAGRKIIIAKTVPARTCAATALIMTEMAGRIAAIPTAEDTSNAVLAIAVILQFVNFNFPLISLAALAENAPVQAAVRSIKPPAKTFGINAVRDLQAVIANVP